jgi:hypothetical protein
MPLMNFEDKVHIQPDGRKFLRIDSSCLEADLSCLQSGDFFGAMVGRSHGYTLDDVAFLKEVPELQGVHIQDAIPDVSAIGALEQLKYLLIAGPCNSVDVSGFNALHELRIVGWNSHVIGIEKCKRLEVLYVNQFSPKKEGISVLAPASGLKELEIVQSSLTDLNGLERFGKLSSLTLRYFKKLQDISQLECLRESLWKLILDRSKRIEDFAPVGTLNGLRNLSITGCGAIESIDFVSSLKNLETIGLMSGTTVLDGDLSLLLKLPVLRFAGIDNKKHYSHSSLELKKFLENRA